MSLQHCWLVEFVNMQANALWKRFTFSENFALFPMFEQQQTAQILDDCANNVKLWNAYKIILNGQIMRKSGQSHNSAGPIYYN